VNSFTATTAPFTQVAGSTNTASIPVSNSSWMTIGQVVFVQTAGYFTVASLPDATHAILTNLGYPGNATNGTVIATSQNISPGGLIGSSGSVTTNNVFSVGDSDFTTNSNTLVAIAGLSWTLFANTAQKVPFRCTGAYSIAGSGQTTVSLGIQAESFAPTNILAVGAIQTSGKSGTNSVFTQDELPVLASTAATVVLTSANAATGTTLVWSMDGLIENPSNASAQTINIMAAAPGGDTVTIKRGSFCKIY
jgi:hypothetical protein